MAKTYGYLGFFTPYVWMFIQSYEKMKQYLYSKATIETLIQFEYSAFEEATVLVCSFTFSNYHISKNGCYLRLTEFRGGMEVQREKALEAILNHKCGFYYEQNSDKFSKIPSSPVAYWASEKMLSSFEIGSSFAGETKKGVLTGDNNTYLRLWQEVSIEKIGFDLYSKADMDKSHKKWFPVTSGGEKRRWYGNFDTIVNLENEGLDIRTNVKNYRLRDPQYYMLEAITWTEISSSIFTCRYVPQGILFGNGGPVSFFFNDKLKYHLALLNSKVAMEILLYLAPTINYGPEQINRIPIVYSNEKKVEQLTSENIEISRFDWNLFETSWDFTRHPLISVITKSQMLFDDISNIDLSECFMAWENECNERFNQLKANEEELNRIFIEIYGLQDELTPQVEDKDVTVRKADLQREIKSLISYAVGCMFGRYSLEKPGLVYAGGDFESVYDKFVPTNQNMSNYTHAELSNFSVGELQKPFCYLRETQNKPLFIFHVNADNIIPICSDEYFTDDIVSRFVKFIEIVYGKKALDSNLRFIADALGGKGQPIDVIRNYFINDFYADHCKIYQKRSIY